MLKNSITRCSVIIAKYAFDVLSNVFDVAHVTVQYGQKATLFCLDFFATKKWTENFPPGVHCKTTYTHMEGNRKIAAHSNNGIKG